MAYSRQSKKSNSKKKLGSSLRWAAETLRLAYPTFIKAEGCVFIDWCYKNTFGIPDSYNRTEREAFTNHIHIFDWFYPYGWDTKILINRPDFPAACAIGKTVAHLWTLKLSAEFPRSRFRVYFTLDEDPIVRFHRVYQGEPYLLNESRWKKEINSGALVIIDTRRLD